MSAGAPGRRVASGAEGPSARSEEHTSELQSRRDLVCRLLLEKKITSLYEHLIAQAHSVVFGGDKRRRVRRTFAREYLGQRVGTRRCTLPLLNGLPTLRQGRCV